MPTEVNQTVPAEIVIQRHGEDKEAIRFVPTLYKRGTKAKAGALYPAIESTVTIDQLIAYLEADNAKNMLLRTLNLFAQNWFENATTGVDPAAVTKDNPEGYVDKDFDLEEFRKYAMELSARGLSKDELDEQIAAACDEINSTVMNASIPLEEKMPLLQKLSDRVKSLNLEKAAKKRKKEDAVTPAVA